MEYQSYVAITTAVIATVSSYLIFKRISTAELIVSRDEDGETIYTSIWAKDGIRCGPNQTIKGDGSVHGNPKEPTTLFQLLNFANEQHGKSEMFGYRELNGTIKQEKNGKVFTYYELSDYKWITMNTFYENAIALGNTFSKSTNYTDVICIFSNTCLEWQLVAHAAFSQGLTIATAYDTLGPDGLHHCLEETLSKIIFCTTDQFPTLLKVLKRKLKYVHQFIYSEGLNLSAEQVTQYIADIKEYVPISHIKQAIAKGNETPIELTKRAPKPKDTACIMYTSGSTGVPKGVVITHSNMMASIGSALDMFSGYLLKDDVYLAYLPLAHILELAIETVCLYWGVKLGFGNPRTLTNQYVKGDGDLKALRPHIMSGVPQVWDTIKKNINNTIEVLPMPFRTVFWTAFYFKTVAMNFNLPTFPIDFLFKLITKETGGRLKFALSGGSPLNKSTQLFLTTTICPVYVGYGLTETCGLGCLMAPIGGVIPGIVGTPLPSIEMKLVSFEECKYYANATPPQGEIWLRGPSVCKGYFNKPDVTKEAFNGEWFLTGDIGEVLKHGVKIIDRKKNLVKLSNGEYIAVEALETVYKQDKMVLNVMICANSECSKPLAVVELNKKGDLNKDALLRSLIATAKEHGLNGTSLIADVVVSQEEWTPQNGLLTAAMKLQRREITKKYEKEINAAYDKLQSK